MTDEKLWTTPEVTNILTAMAAAHGTLPWPLRFLLRNWVRALVTLGIAISQMSIGYDEQSPKIWTRQEIMGILAMLYDEPHGHAWRWAISAASVALFGQMTTQGQVELDPEIWGEL